MNEQFEHSTPTLQEQPHDFSSELGKVDLSKPEMRVAFAQYMMKRLFPTVPGFEVTTVDRTIHQDDGVYVLEVTHKTQESLANEPTKQYLKIVSTQRFQRMDNRITHEQAQAQADAVVSFMRQLGPESDETTHFASILAIAQNQDHYLSLQPEYRESLADRLHQAEQGQRTALSWSEILQTTEALAHIMSTFEAQGIIHWDPSLENIRTKYNDQHVVEKFVLSDFDTLGLASDARTQGRLNYVGSLYAAPETNRTREENQPQNDHLSAIYSAAEILYHCITHRLSYDRKPRETEEQFWERTQKGKSRMMLMSLQGANDFQPTYQNIAHIFFGLPSDSQKQGELDDLYVRLEELDSVFQKALAANPADRYQTAQEFFDALIPCLQAIQPVEYAQLWSYETPNRPMRYDSIREIPAQSIVEVPATPKTEKVDKSTLIKLITHFKNTMLGKPSHG